MFYFPKTLLDEHKGIKQIKRKTRNEGRVNICLFLFFVGHLVCVSGKLPLLGNALVVAHMQSVQASNVWCALVPEMTDERFYINI